MTSHVPIQLNWLVFVVLILVPLTYPSIYNPGPSGGVWRSEEDEHKQKVFRASVTLAAERNIVTINLCDFSTGVAGVSMQSAVPETYVMAITSVA